MVPLSFPYRGRRQALAGIAAFLLLSAANLLSPLAVQAADEPGCQLVFKTERVIVFKDGYCLVLKRGVAASDRTGAVYTDAVPDAAVLGSFWAIPKEGRLLSMVAGWEEAKTTEEKQLPCLQTIEVLKANAGQKCSVQLPDNSILQGTIQEVLAQETTAAVDDSLRSALGLSSDSPVASRLALSSSAPVPDSAVRTLSGITGTYFVLRAEQGDVLLAANDIRRLTIANMKTALGRKLTSTSTSDTQRHISIESDVYGDGNEPSPGHRSIWPGAGARPSIAEGTATCGARTQSAKSALTPRVSDGRRSDSSRYAKACWQRLTPCNQRLPARAASSVNSDSRPAAR